jgi:hypothetical protein
LRAVELRQQARGLLAKQRRDLGSASQRRTAMV